MKKLISICIATIICCLLVPFSFAEQFPLRNNIYFGDSKETVKEKENTLKLIGETDAELEYQGEIAGFEGNAKFYFSEEGKLVDFIYTFEKNPLDVYLTILKSCIRQYGEYLNDSDSGTISNFPGKAQDLSDKIDYKEWVLIGKYDENVTINLVEYTYSKYISKRFIDFPATAISYHFFTNDDVQNKLIEIENAEKEADAVF